MTNELSQSQRRVLKGRAHGLHPVVMIGDKGLTDAVLHEIEINLKSHELIKVHVGGADREQREAMFETLCARLSAHPVQHIGRILVIYREEPKPLQASGTPEAAHPKRATGPTRPRVPDDRLRRLGRGSSAPRPAAATRVRPRGRTG